MVAEVDESDRSLRDMAAAMAIVTNLEADHLDHYKDLNEIIDTVATFVRGVNADGTIIVCGDDAGTLELARRIGRPVVTYGFGPDSHVRGEIVRMDETGSRFQVWDAGEELGEFRLQVLGRHNVANALSVIAAARRLGVPLAPMKEALADFRSVARRFQAVGDFHGMAVIDDYAHHPSEIRAVLAAARLQGKPITAVFQPHRFSRLAAFLTDFAESLTAADRVIVTDVYAAGEKPEDWPIKGPELAEAVRHQAPDLDVSYIGGFEAITERLASVARSGDLLLMLGAGDITKLAHRLGSATVATAG
jgi:UDP-N-acetylmuramate--alanine ligase